MTKSDKEFLEDFVKDVHAQALEGNKIVQVLAQDILRVIILFDEALKSSVQQTQAKTSARKRSSS